jgi:hypothetical protein
LEPGPRADNSRSFSTFCQTLAQEFNAAPAVDQRNVPPTKDLLQPGSLRFQPGHAVRRPEVAFHLAPRYAEGLKELVEEHGSFSRFIPLFYSSPLDEYSAFPGLSEQS